MFVKNPNLGADPNLGDFTVVLQENEKMEESMLTISWLEEIDSELEEELVEFKRQIFMLYVNLSCFVPSCKLVKYGRCRINLYDILAWKNCKIWCYMTFSSSILMLNKASSLCYRVIYFILLFYLL